MTTLYHQIEQKFVAELAKSNDVSAKKLDEIKSLLAAGKKLKVEDLVKIFTGAEDDEVK